MSSSENAMKVRSLDENQRVYLRLVAQGMTSKQIAQSVQGSYHTVNVEIGIAMRLLGAKSRHEAAAMVEQAEGASSYEPSYEPEPLAVLGAGNARSDEDEGERTEEERGWSIPVATRARPANTLTMGQRSIWILVIATATVLLLGGLVSGMASLLVSLDRLL
jgi:DNA-binding CsgD family transcriptional regulator